MHIHNKNIICQFDAAYFAHIYASKNIFQVTYILETQSHKQCHWKAGCQMLW